DLRRYFVERSRERAQFAAQLAEVMEEVLGRWQTTREGTVAGALRRSWFDVKRALGGGDATILDSVEAGENAARDKYQKALREPLPDRVLVLVRTQAQSVFSSHDHVRALRDRRKAA